MPLLHAARHTDPNPAKGGGDITVVGGTALLSETGPSGTLADIEEHAPSSDQISIYVVQDADTLSQIAKMFDVTVNTIRWANDIDPNESIRPGQTLVILPISGVRHEVEKGDTLKSIAKEYGGDLEEISQYNNLPLDSVLVLGDVIVIPDGEVETVVEAPKQSPKRGGGSVAGAARKDTSGYFIRPISGGYRSQGLHGYNAIDLASAPGTPIMAAAAGTVIVSRNYGWNGGYGNYIVVRHPNGTQTLYAHNSQNIVYAGERVVQGQVIGYIGTTGRSTGPHLHFEVRGGTNPF